MRDETGTIRLYKHDYNLYSDREADDDDPVVVVKAIVRTPRKTIVAVPVTRQLLNDAGAESLCRYMERECFHAAELLLDHFAQEPQIIYAPNGGSPNPNALQTIEAGVADRYVDDFDPADHQN